MLSSSFLLMKLLSFCVGEESFRFLTNFSYSALWFQILILSLESIKFIITNKEINSSRNISISVSYKSHLVWKRKSAASGNRSKICTDMISLIWIVATDFSAWMISSNHTKLPHRVIKQFDREIYAFHISKNNESHRTKREIFKVIRAWCFIFDFWEGKRNDI